MNTEHTKKYKTIKKIITIFACLLIGIGFSLGQTPAKLGFLANFVTLGGGKYMPELSQPEAALLGATVEQYNEYIKHIDSLNTIKKYPNNTCDRFLFAHLVVENGRVFLNISREKAIRAGAKIEGFNAIQQSAQDYNNNLPADEIENFRININKTRAEIMDYATKHPDKSAVEQILDPAKMAASY